MPAPLIDIGANLAHESFDIDRAAVLERAWQAGLQAIVITGSSAASNAAAIELCKLQPQRLFATAGLHPHHASDWDAPLAAQLRLWAQHPSVVALGECGLDYFRDLSPRADQRRAFVGQLQLAVELQRPVFLHQRDAHEDFFAILREYRAAMPGALVHCFTDTPEALEDYLSLDCDIGITGWICDERRGRHLLEAVTLIPDQRLMLETDAPYLLPRNAPRRAQRRNEPELLPYVLACVAAARGQDADRLAQQTTANARRYFRLPTQPD